MKKRLSKYIIIGQLLAATSAAAANPVKPAPSFAVSDCISMAYGFARYSKYPPPGTLFKLKQWLFLPKAARNFNEEKYLAAHDLYLDPSADLQSQWPHTFNKKLALLDALLMSLNEYRFLERQQGHFSKRQMAKFIEDYALARVMTQKDIRVHSAQIFDILHGQEFSLVPNDNLSYRKWLARMFETNLLSAGSFTYLNKFRMNEKYTFAEVIQHHYKKSKIKWVINTLINVSLLTVGKTPKLTYLKMSHQFFEHYAENGLDFALTNTPALTKLRFKNAYAYQRFRKHLGLSIVAADIYLIYLVMIDKFEKEQKQLAEDRVRSLKRFPIRNVSIMLENASHKMKLQLLEEVTQDFLQEERRPPTKQELSAIREVIFPKGPFAP